MSAWIEISPKLYLLSTATVALFVSAWIEIADMTFHGHHDTANISKADLNFKKTSMYIEFDNSLEKGDKVTMIRLDGGQQFYLFERLGEDGFGF